MSFKLVSFFTYIVLYDVVRMLNSI